MTYRPPQCSEREPDGTWEDCTWAAGVDLGNAAHGRQVYPTTQTEYEGLRTASGDSMSGGSNVTPNLETGMLERWGWKGTILVAPSMAVLWAALKPGVGAVVQGSMGAFPAGHRLRRWDPKFAAGHAVYVQREDTGLRVWWMNPQAPTSFAGEWITYDELRRFVTALPGGSAMTVVIGSRIPLPDTATEEDMVEITVDPYPTPIAVTGTNVTLFLPDGTRQKVATLSSLALGTASIDQSTDRAPKGSGWLKLAKRPWAGWFVPAASVTLAAQPTDAIALARAAGREGYRREIDQYVETHP